MWTERLVVPSYWRFTLTHVGKTVCVASNVTTSSLSDLQKGICAGKPVFSSCISPVKEPITCNTSYFTVSFHPSLQGYFLFLVFQGEYFCHFAFLIWEFRSGSHGRELLQWPDSLSILRGCVLSNIDLFKIGYKPELWNSPGGALR